MVRWGGRWRGKEDGVSSNLSICIVITTCPALDSLSFALCSRDGKTDLDRQRQTSNSRSPHTCPVPVY